MAEYTQNSNASTSLTGKVLKFFKKLIQIIQGSSQSSLVLHLKMNDDAENWVVIDSSQTANNGILYDYNESEENTDGYNTTGLINGALQFDPLSVDGSFVLVPYNAAYDVKGKFSIAMWVYIPNAIPGDTLYPLFYLGDQNNDESYIELRLQSKPSGEIMMRFEFYNSITEKEDSLSEDTIITAAGWYHVAVTIDSTVGTGRMNFYINSAEIADSETNGTEYDPNINVPIYIGSDYLFNVNELIYIDDFRFYNRKLTESEVGDIYNSGAGTENEDVVLGQSSTGPVTLSGKIIKFISQTIKSGSISLVASFKKLKFANKTLIPAAPGWEFNYRKKITIAGSTGAGTDYPVLLKIGNASGGDFNLDGNSSHFPSGKGDSGDIRFLDTNGDPLKFWVETVISGVAYVWVKVESDLNTDQDIYVEYGGTAQDLCDPENVFPFFDDFEGTSIDTGKWLPPGVITVTGSEAIMDTGLNSSTSYFLKSLYQIIPGMEFRYRMKYVKHGAYAGDPYNEIGEYISTGANFNSLANISVRRGAGRLGYPVTLLNARGIDNTGTTNLSKGDQIIENAYYRNYIRRTQTNTVLDYNHALDNYTSSVNYDLSWGQGTNDDANLWLAVRKAAYYHVDWVFARKAIDIEPVFDAAGAEQEGPSGFQLIPKSMKFIARTLGASMSVGSDLYKGPSFSASFNLTAQKTKVLSKMLSGAVFYVDYINRLVSILFEATFSLLAGKAKKLLAMITGATAGLQYVYGKISSSDFYSVMIWNSGWQININTRRVFQTFTVPAGVTKLTRIVSNPWARSLAEREGIYADFYAANPSTHQLTGPRLARYFWPKEEVLVSSPVPYLAADTDVDVTPGGYYGVLFSSNDYYGTEMRSRDPGPYSGGLLNWYNSGWSPTSHDLQMTIEGSEYGDILNPGISATKAIFATGFIPSLSLLASKMLGRIFSAAVFLSGSIRKSITAIFSALIDMTKIPGAYGPEQSAGYDNQTPVVNDNYYLSSRYWDGQQFIATVPRITRAYIRLGNSSDQNWTFEIYASNGSNQPTGPALSSITYLASTLVPQGQYNWVSVPLNPATVTVGQKYMFIVRGDSITSSAGKVSITNGMYADGYYVYSSTYGASWHHTESAYDLSLAIYGVDYLPAADIMIWTKKIVAVTMTFISGAGKLIQGVAETTVALAAEKGRVVMSKVRSAVVMLQEIYSQISNANFVTTPLNPYATFSVGESRILVQTITIPATINKLRDFRFGSYGSSSGYDNIYVDIYAADTGTNLPTGPMLSRTTWTDAEIPGSQGWSTIKDLDTPVTPGGYYAIRISSDGPASTPYALSPSGSSVYSGGGLMYYIVGSGWLNFMSQDITMELNGDGGEWLPNPGIRAIKYVRMFTGAVINFASGAGKLIQGIAIATLSLGAWQKLRYKVKNFVASITFGGGTGTDILVILDTAALSLTGDADKKTKIIARAAAYLSVGITKFYSYIRRATINISQSQSNFTHIITGASLSLNLSWSKKEAHIYRVLLPLSAVMRFFLAKVLATAVIFLSRTTTKLVMLVLEGAGFTVGLLMVGAYKISRLFANRPKITSKS